MSLNARTALTEPCCSTVNTCSVQQGNRILRPAPHRRTVKTYLCITASCHDEKPRVFPMQIYTVLLICRGVASMRQEEAIASSSCNCVLVSSVKSSLNTAPKCSILRSNNKKFSGSSPSRSLFGGHPSHIPPLSAPRLTNVPSALDLITLPPLKLKSVYTPCWSVMTLALELMHARNVGLAVRQRLCARCRLPPVGFSTVGLYGCIGTLHRRRRRQRSHW